MSNAIEIKDLSYSYKTRKALSGMSLSVEQGKIFGLLGPNGSGKTTLFRILSTFFPVTEGIVRIDGLDLKKEKQKIRQRIGVVFQSPSLDSKLTVMENLKHQGHLYGMSGSSLNLKANEMLSQLGIKDRAKEIVEKLSGGLKRRAEIAKGLLHTPKILILDEPSTGLDPGARMDLWKYLKGLREQEGMTILVTTHLMEEAEHCDQLAILSEGQKVSEGTPQALKHEIGGDVLEIKTDDVETLMMEIKTKFELQSMAIDGGLQLEHDQGHRFVTDLVEAFPGRINAVTFRKPTLEDVFIHHTGHRFWEEQVEV